MCACRCGWLGSLPGALARHLAVVVVARTSVNSRPVRGCATRGRKPVGFQVVIPTLTDSQPRETTSVTEARNREPNKEDLLFIHLYYLYLKNASLCLQRLLLLLLLLLCFVSASSPFSSPCSNNSWPLGPDNPIFYITTPISMPQIIMSLQIALVQQPSGMVVGVRNRLLDRLDDLAEGS